MLDTLRQVAASREEVESVFDIVARLAQDVGTYPTSTATTTIRAVDLDPHESGSRRE